MSKGTQEDRDRYSALTVEFQDDEIILSGLELHPGAPVRDQLGGRHHTARGAVQFRFKIDTW